MQTGMLGDNKVLREFWNGPLSTLLERVNGPEGQVELEVFKRYLRKEDPWPKEMRPVSKRLTKSIKVDLDADPFVPEGWTVEEHRPGGIVTVSQKRGKLCLNGEPIKLYLAKDQQNGRTIDGNTLWQELKDKPVVNANLLNALLKPENQHLIPEDWKGKYLFFWATHYRDADDDRCVRGLDWDDGQWDWCFDWLDDHWYGNDPAVLAANPLVP